jgi:hypothetical protein
MAAKIAQTSKESILKPVIQPPKYFGFMPIINMRDEETGRAKLVEFDRHRVLIDEPTWVGWVSLGYWIRHTLARDTLFSDKAVNIFPVEHRGLLTGLDNNDFKFAVAHRNKGKNPRVLDWIQSEPTLSMRKNWASPVAWLATLLNSESGMKPECFAIVVYPKVEGDKEDLFRSDDVSSHDLNDL